MILIQIIPIILLVNVVKTLVLDPICKSCLFIDQSLISTTYHQQFNVSLTTFQLPGFSQSIIIVDFRHLNSIPLNNGETIFQFIFEITDLTTSNKQTVRINDTVIGSNQYQLSSTAKLSLRIFFFIQDQYKAFQYLLRDSVSLNLSYSNDRIPDQDSSYVFVVSSQDNINLPANKPDLTNMNNYYLENQKNQSSFLSTTTYSYSSMYWSTNSQFAVPYFPYFANCQGQGQMLHITQLLQSQADCTLIPINETQWISQFSFGSSATADRCSLKRKCTIAGPIETTQYPVWNTLPLGLTLFSISQQKIPWSSFSYDMNFLSQDLVLCKINSSLGSNSSQLYPLKVKMVMGYYQVSQTQKKIISCHIVYDLYVASTQNFTYQLDIVSYPLNHTYIMLNFGFKWYVYMIVFVIIGFVGNLQNLILWIYHYFVAEQRRDIKIMMYFRIIYQIIKGTLMALILQIGLIIIVCVLMNGKIFQTQFYSLSDNGSTTPRVLFDYLIQNPTNNYDSDQMQNLRAGRMGIAFITIGVMIIILKCKYFIGKQKTTEQYKNFQILGRTFQPISWNRGKFLFGTFFYIILIYFFIYFAYSTVYSANIWTFIVVMKVLQVIMQQITKSVYDDILPGLPLKIIIDITAYLNTISAADLYDFLFGSLIDVAITMIQKLYIFQIQNIIVDKIIEKSQEFNKFYLNLMNQEDGDQQKVNMLSGQQYLINDDQDSDNQQVFIKRQVQQVQFFEEQVKQVYLWVKAEQQKKMILLCKDTQQQKKMKKKYFEALQKDYKCQRQLLFRDNKEMSNQQQQKQNRVNENNENNQNPQGQVAQAQRQQAMQKQSAIFQLLLDHMAMIYTYLVNPFVVFIFWLTYDQSAVLANYGIVYNTVVLYILSALVIGVFSVINIIMIFHILQSYMGFSFQQQINDILSRFNLRKTFWKADQEQLKDNLKPQILGADHYCLSSQLFFILTVYIGGMILVMLGMSIVFQVNYNFFDDIATIPIIIFWVGFIFVFRIIVKRVAILFNVWDYNKYVQQNNEQSSSNDNNDNEGKNIYGVMDNKQLIRQMQQNSDFKTQNIIFAQLQQLPKFKRLFNIQQKINNKNKQRIKQKLQQQQQKQIQCPFAPIINKNQIIQQKVKKNKWIIQQQQLRLNNKQQRQQIILAQKRLQTICKKLQPLFNKQSFKLDYTKKHNQYIKQNIQKILPLVQSLPQLQQFKNILPSLTHNHNLNTGGIIDNKNNQPIQQQQQKKQQSSSVNNKNMDPVIAQIILQWLRATQKARAKRISNGLQEQSKLKKCSFCYQTWGLYYGNGGMCLQCSMKVAKRNKQLAYQRNKRSLKQINRLRINNEVNDESKRSNKKRKNTRKKNNLNVIKQEQDKQEDNQSKDQDYDSQQDLVIKGGQKKQHKD